MAEREDVNVVRSRRGAAYTAPRGGAASGGGEERNPDEIRSDIEQTRAELGDTVEAIKEKFSSEHMKAQVKESTVGRARRMSRRAQGRAREMGSNIADTIRSNPVPAAMVGVGLGWLIMKGARGDGNGRETTLSERETFAYAPGGQIWTEEGQGTGGGYEQQPSARETAKGRAEQFAGQARAKAEEVTGQVRERAGQMTGQAREKASQLTSKAREQADRVGGMARQRARQTKENVRDMMQSNPLGVGAMALGLGALFGLIIPESRREEELMGGASESLMGKAKETAQGIMEKAQRSAEKAKEAAMEEARS
ncbi:MAG: DUF3618 domain-containing protein [Nitrospirota bacterium]